MFTTTNREAIDKIDSLLRGPESFRAVPLDGDVYREWYALMLGALATVAGDEKIIFATGRHDSETDSAQVLMFTESLLTVVDVAKASTAEAVVLSRAVSRRAIRSLGLGISERHDFARFSRELDQWPGEFRITLEYETLPAPVEFTALSYNPYRTDETAPASLLIEGLRADLQGR